MRLIRSTQITFPGIQVERPNQIHLRSHLYGIILHFDQKCFSFKSPGSKAVTLSNIRSICSHFQSIDEPCENLGFDLSKAFLPRNYLRLRSDRFRRDSSSFSENWHFGPFKSLRANFPTIWTKIEFDDNERSYTYYGFIMETLLRRFVTWVYHFFLRIIKKLKK